ncbi:hypothetical protein [Paraburkholderia ribeironis]|uniref:hypothetical protein n=1 Tax=Paraburkholderia ribeironis TaxID=1247936 RepID=UPI001177F3DB|nr:hypothetical protein [Paraburkholderia ribeironis]
MKTSNSDLQSRFNAARSMAQRSAPRTSKIVTPRHITEEQLEGAARPSGLNGMPKAVTKLNPAKPADRE